MGFSLLEILICLSIISVAMLPLAKEAVFARQHMTEIYYHHQALLFAVSLRERLIANSNPTYRQNEIQIWQNEIAQLFPKGKGALQSIPSYCNIAICWHLRRNQCVRIKLPI